MRRSSTAPARNGSPEYSERPIQFCVVLPRLDGRSVIALLRPTSTPSTYRMPTPPDSVTATWCQPPVGSAAVPSIRCSPPAPLVVMAKRIGPEPDCGVRNMFVVVPVPRSKMRRQALVEVSLTQVAIVKSFRALTLPAGQAPDWLVPV